MGKKPKDMTEWLEIAFESSSSLTSEFFAFANAFKQYLKRQTGQHFVLEGWNMGHFYVGGFLYNSRTGKHVYFSTSDVRHFPNEWYSNVLIRTAKNTSDYTGGDNNYCPLYRLNETALRLTAIDK
jgi:hypothetical protein